MGGIGETDSSESVDDVSPLPGAEGTMVVLGGAVGTTVAVGTAVADATGDGFSDAAKA